MKKRKIVFLFALFLLISLIVFSGYKTVVFALEDKKIKEEINHVNDMVKVIANDILNDNKIKLYQEKYQNEDIIGILSIDGVITTPLVQTDNNNYYLNHLVNKNYNKTGSIFVDYRTDIDKSKQVNIFGHSSTIYDIPFNNLKKYLSENFYKEHKILTIETENNIYTYEIFAVKVTSDEEHLNIFYQNNSEFEEHLQKLKSDALYETNVDVSNNDSILTLQTCIFNDPRGSLLIINLRKVG